MGLVDVSAREIGDDEYVSQYGSRMTGKPDFRDRPRSTDRDALSGIVGQVTAAEARRLVRTAGPATDDDGVRDVLAGDLRQQGFVVTHTPTRRNKRHVSIRYPVGAWDDPVAGMFDERFGEPRWHEEQEGGPE